MKKFIFLKNKFLLLILLASSIYNINATTYYVSNTGKDNSSGTSSGEAFATISKINNLTLNPGDSVLFEAGGIWRETLHISNSGSEDNWIYYGRYGEGKNPAIYASNTATWTATGTPNVWQATGLTVYSLYSDAPSGRQGRIFFVKNDSATWGLWRSNAALEDLDQEYEYTANAGSDIHYLYSQNDPNSYYDAIEVTQRSFCMTLDGTNNINYIIINGIDLKYSREANFRGGYPVPQGHHLVIRNCSIQYVGVPGSSHAYGIETMHSDLLIENCFITDAGRRAISMNWYDLSSGHNSRRCENVIIRNNTFKRGWHTTGLDLALNETNDFDTVQGVYYYNNIHDDSELSDAGGYITGGSPRLTSNQIFTYAVSNNSVNGIYIVNNVFIHPTARGLNINHADSIFVWNNTFFGHNKTLEFKNPDGQVSIQDNGVILDARNNLLHDNFTGGEWEYGIHAYNVQPTISKRDFNFFSYDMAGRANSRIATIFNGTSHSYPGRNITGMNYLRGNGFELNSPNPNYPYFIDADNFDLHLSPNSDAVDAGTPVQIIVTDPFGINDTIGKYDINGVVRNPITPSIGAYEYIDPDPTKADILDFELPQQAGDAIIDTIENTVTIQVNYGTNVTSLSPTILVSPNATIEPASGVSRDFTSTQEYTVTSKNGYKQVWSATIIIEEPSNSTNILEFSFDQQIGNTIINNSEHTITVEVEFGTDITSLSPSIILDKGAIISPSSNETQDFSSPATYSVTAEDGITQQEWIIYVSVSDEIIDNHSPKIVVSNQSILYKGLTYIFNASQTYDLDDDALNFNWDIPQELIASSTSENTILILVPTEIQSGSYNIGLSVNDGEKSSSEQLDIEVSDLNPNAQEINILSIKASSYEEGNSPSNIIDNNQETRWSADGDNQWLEFELEQNAYITHFNLSFHNGDQRNTYFDLYASEDSENWDPILEDNTSCGFWNYYQAFDIPETKSSKSYKYIKLLGHMNSVSSWNSYNEFKVYGFHEATTNSNYELHDSKTINVYPNPASTYVNINTEGNSRIVMYDLTGRIVYNNYYNENLVKLNFNLKKGTYIIQVFKNDKLNYNEKLVIM